MTPLHPVVSAAARGELPSWAIAGPKRQRHMERVSALLRDWAGEASVTDLETERWASAGYLHDALRDEDPARLAKRLPREWAEIPGRILHGPAAAQRLREDGVDDAELLTAVAYHTLGHRDFGTLGRMLYAADFLEPGRLFRKEWRAKLRSRMPGDLDEVVKEIVAARIRHLIDHGRPVRPETMAFWNSMTTGEPWVGASEV